jgi:hypothetical protein
VPDNARVVDAERVQHRQHPLGVRLERQRSSQGAIASPIPEKIQNDDPVPLGHEWHDMVPEMRGRREAVQKNDRLSSAATSSGIIVEP